MSRPTKQLKLNNTIAVIVDGQTEQWYIECAKRHYREGTLRAISIAPKLPQKKKIDELVSLAKEKVLEGYKKVVLIVDFDEVLSNNNEFERFKILVNTPDIWMKDVMVIVNNPCLEYWYLLHFEKTNRFYLGFNNEMKKALQKHLPNYDKGNKYYCDNPDIYTRLGGNEGLSTARNNANSLPPFDIHTCKERGVSEMSKIFDYFDSLYNVIPETNI